MASQADIARYRRELVPDDEMCNCVPPYHVNFWLSWTENNPSRRFTRCPRSFVPAEDCRYFRWIYPEVSTHYGRIIMYLKYECGFTHLQRQLDYYKEAAETYKELWVTSEDNVASLVYAANVKKEEFQEATTVMQNEMALLKNKMKKQTVMIGVLVTALVAVVGVGVGINMLI